MVPGSRGARPPPLRLPQRRRIDCNFEQRYVRQRPVEDSRDDVRRQRRRVDHAAHGVAVDPPASVQSLSAI